MWSLSSIYTFFVWVPYYGSTPLNFFLTLKRSVRRHINSSMCFPGGFSPINSFLLQICVPFLIRNSFESGSKSCWVANLGGAIPRRKVCGCKSGRKIRNKCVKLQNWAESWRRKKSPALECGARRCVWSTSWLHFYILYPIIYVIQIWLSPMCVVNLPNLTANSDCAQNTMQLSMCVAWCSFLYSLMLLSVIHTWWLNASRFRCGQQCAFFCPPPLTIKSASQR